MGVTYGAIIAHRLDVATARALPATARAAPALMQAVAHLLRTGNALMARRKRATGPTRPGKTLRPDGRSATR